MKNEPCTACDAGLTSLGNVNSDCACLDTLRENYDTFLDQENQSPSGAHRQDEWMDPAIDACILAAYNAGLDDAAIVRQSGVSGSVVWNWRRRRGYHANIFGADRKLQLLVQKAYDKGFSDEEIASSTGADICKIEKWRHQRKLPRNDAEERTKETQAVSPRRKRWDKDLAHRMYASGFTDQQIAIEVGVCAGTIRNWRIASGLASQSALRRDAAELDVLYARGCADNEIARQSGYSLSQIRHWRRKNGLKANRASAAMDDRRLALYLEGMSDGEIARAVGVSTGAIFSWRKRNNLEANRPCWAKDKWDEDRALTLYREGRSDRDIAAHIGVSSAAVFGWRKRNGLAANLHEKDHSPISEQP